MWIIGVDYHPRVQQIALVNTDTEECVERRLSHREGEAEKFYRELKAEGCRVRVRMEATGHGRWFERLLAELGFELVDWRSDEDQGQASAKAEDRPPGCRAAAVGSLSSGVGTQCGKSRSATAAVASPSAGADAHADRESAAGRGHE